MGYIKGTLSIILLLFLFSCGQKNIDSEFQFADFADIYEEPYNSGEELRRGTRWEYLVIHCTANYRPITKERLLQIFRSYGWSRPGYNIFITREGKSDTLVPFNMDLFITSNEIANGVRGYNSRSIHIAYDGGVDRNLRPRDTRTIPQRQELLRHINYIRFIHPHIKIVGHTNLDRFKACPSFDVISEYRLN
jgi:N-acetylmuramoyl-L-alanine amidase